MFDIAVTRNQFGANNTRDTETFSDQPVEDRTKVHEYNNDFDEFNTANYTVSLTGTAGTTFAAQSGDGGLIQGVSAAVANSGYSIQNVRGDYTFANGLRTFAEFVFSVDSALANILVGMTNITAAPFTAANITDGIYVQSLGTTALNVIMAAGSNKITQAAVAVLNPGLGNFVTFKFYWDGALYSDIAPTGQVIWELSGNGVVTPVRGAFSSAPGSAFALPATFPDAVVQSPLIGFTASSAAARTMQVDLFSIIKERTNFTQTPVF